MKTFLLQKEIEDIGTVRTEIKVDAFCPITDFLQEGFDTRFTNMEVVSETEFIKAGLDLKQVENRFQSLLTFAKDNECTLDCIDLNSKTSSFVQIYEPSTEEEEVEEEEVEEE